MTHNFNASLAKSHTAEELPLWEECYQKAFAPYFASMTSHRRDGFWQRDGIDRTVVLTTSKVYRIDEKIRWKSYNDVLLEFMSNDKTCSPGWVCKPLMCDYIAYAIAPAGLCLLLPVVQLQQAWERNGQKWKSIYRTLVAKNNTYNTLSIAVPIDALFNAIGAALRISFTPMVEHILDAILI